MGGDRLQQTNRFAGGGRTAAKDIERAGLVQEAGEASYDASRYSTKFAVIFAT
jgi:hypothetical protein